MKPQRYIATLAILLPAVVLHLIPECREWLEYRRSAIFQGEIWRLFTGHWIHWSFSHLFWNGSLIAITGSLIESHSRRQLVTAVAVGVVLIGPVLLLLDPALMRYAGLSGIAAGCVAALVIRNVGHRKPNGTWIAIGLLLLLKMTVEWFDPTPLLAVSTDTPFRSVPLAHLVGAVAGIGAVLCSVPRRQVPQPDVLELHGHRSAGAEL